MNKNKTLSIAVIGAGASGLAAAIFAAREAASLNVRTDISLYDSNSRVGKKILVTGNGRCNFTNENISASNFHGESDFAYRIYSEFDCEATKEFFLSLGLFSKTDSAGRVYPMSMQASSVLDALRFEVRRLNISEVTDTKITSLTKKGNKFLLNNKFTADKVIIATGGKAAPVQGSDGSGFNLLSALGVKHSPLLSALAPVCCENFTKSLKGIRAQGTVTIKSQGKVLSQVTGEIQYTDYGLSGIPTMQASRFAAEALNKGNEVFVYVDSAPSFSEDELKSVLLSFVKNHPDFTCEMLLAGIMPKKLGTFLISECSLNPSREIGSLHPSVIERIASVVKNKKYKISSVKGFNDAQVTAGGIPANEINEDTMELKKIKGLYVCGEIVNVDGDCGGYNLQWAWSSAYKAGINTVREN